MLGESHFWDLGAAFRLSLGRGSGGQNQCLHTWGLLVVGGENGQPAGWWGSAPGNLCATLPSNPSLIASPQNLGSPRHTPLCSWWELGYHSQAVGWQWRPEQASHGEAFPVYEWLPLG